MSFRGGRGGGGFDRGGREGFDRGGGRGGFRGGRGGGRGGFSGPVGPPDVVQEMGVFKHAVEGEMLCASTDVKHVPYFNAPIYLQNKAQIGKVDEILGPINEVFFTVKMDAGMVATSFKENDKVYIGGDKLLPIERFLPKPKSAKPPGKKRGGAARGGFGGGRGGRGAPRGGGFGARGREGPPRGRGGFGGGGGGFAPRGRGGPPGRGFSRGGGRGGGFRGRGS